MFINGLPGERKFVASLNQSGLEWTTTPPSEPGWYWAKLAVPDAGVDDIEIVRVFDDDWAVFSVGEETRYEVVRFTHWLGPLPVPEPPT